MPHINQAKERLFNEYLTTIPSKADLPPEIKQWLSDIEWQLHTAHSLLYCLCASGDAAAERQDLFTKFLSQEMPAALRVVDRLLEEILAELMQP